MICPECECETDELYYSDYWDEHVCYFCLRMGEKGDKSYEDPLGW